jgi:hypothetical protein
MGKSVTAPVRIQRRRTKAWRMPADTVYVGRPSEFGNPFMIGGVLPHPLEHLGLVEVRDALHACVLFDNWLTLTEEGKRVARQARVQLRGKNLACWCMTGQPCHADILLKIANT